MGTPDYETWFRAYAESYTRSLGGEVEVETIRGFFAETVLALGVDGTLNPASTTDEAFGDMLVQMYAFYTAIGTQRMAVDRVEVSPLYDNHDRVRVFYRADYEKRERERRDHPVRPGLSGPAAKDRSGHFRLHRRRRDGRISSTRPCRRRRPSPACSVASH